MKDNRKKSDRPELHRCHWCANRECGYQGVRRTVTGGCPSFIFLDPALRPRKWETLDGEKRRRIRIRTSVYLLGENVDFLKDVVLPSNPKKFEGSLTRGVHACVDVWLNELNGAIPEIPAREPGKFVLETVSATFLPESMEGLNRIVAYWRESDRRVTRSDIVDYFVGLSRQRYENRKQGA